MRIISGRLGGQNFDAPDNRGKTHPMSEKARGGIFNALGDISGLTLLDPFSGTGAIGIEAMSRDAKYVTMIDADKTAARVIQENVDKFKLGDKAKVIRANASGWSDLNVDELYDIVICDPPFEHLQPDTISKLLKHVKRGGLFILSWPGKIELPDFAMPSIKTQNYGDNQIAFYRI